MDRGRRHLGHAVPARSRITVVPAPADTEPEVATTTDLQAICA